MDDSKSDGQYEVLSPWAEAEPRPMKGLAAPRLTDLASKKLGLLCNTKRAARPISNVVERKLKERYPTCEISRYTTLNAVGPAEIDTENRTKFEEWLKGIDAVVATVGD